jgi:oxygen-independent coproporphyrinogen-3 oxidase
MHKICINNREFPILRGYKLSRDDLIRRDVINEILCYHSLDYSGIESKYDIDFSKYFHQEIESSDDLVRDGMLDISHGKITVTSLGKIFIPHVCKVFDYLLQGDKVYKISGP